uniref:DAGKc domain-containing protein n=1 Tax=Elaeophora elaphi TaxID=1147741 RepID=A0A0R3RMP5_9BILA
MSNMKQQLKLAIIFNNNDKRTKQKVESRALRAAEKIRCILGDAPICTVAHSVAPRIIMENTGWKRESLTLMFIGSDVYAPLPSTPPTKKR